MNTRDLAYFVQLIQEKNFSKVAQDFGVTQPTITLAIKRLETEFQTKLVVRDRTHSELTATTSGKQLAVHAQAILRKLDLSHQEVGHITQDRTILGLPPIIETHYFPQVAARLQAQGMLEQLETLSGGSVWLRHALLDGQADLALLGSMAPLTEQVLVTEIFDQQPFAIFVAATHPLAKRKRIYFSELKREKFVLFNSSFVHNTAFNTLTRRNHFRPEVVFRANDTHVIMNLVAENVGVTFLTGIVDQHRDDVVRLALLDDEQPEFVASIAYRKSHVLTPAQERVLAVLRATLKSELPF